MNKESKYNILLLLFLLLLIPCESYSQNDSLYIIYNYNNFQTAPLFKDTINFDSIDYKRLNAAVFFETNRVRVNNNLPTLNYHPILEKVATLHSQQMVIHNFFDHYNRFDRSLRTPTDRIKKENVVNPYIAENIIEEFGIQYNSKQKVTPTAPGKFITYPGGSLILHHTYLSFAQKAVDNWMHSVPHKKNILSREANSLGCGSQIYFKKDFYDMPMFKVTQNFQLFEPIVVK